MTALEVSAQSADNPSTRPESAARVEYMRRHHAQRMSDQTDWDRARDDALNILAAIDESELNARVFTAPWRAQRLRDALIVLAAAVPQETPVSRIGRVA